METAAGIKQTGRESIGGVIRAAFIASLPVLMGYFSMGAAFGVLLVSRVPEANVFWALLMSATTLSGSMQFAAVEMLRDAAGYSLALTAMLALLINIRYMIYGLPFIRIFRNYPLWMRWFMIFGLTDESYAIACGTSRRGIRRMLFIFCVFAFDFLYWQCGCATGALLGRHLPFPTDGIDFAMVALFIVILVDLCRKRINWFPAAIGAAVTAVLLLCTLLLAPELSNKMLLPAMLIIVAILFFSVLRNGRRVKG